MKDEGKLQFSLQSGEGVDKGKVSVTVDSSGCEMKSIPSFMKRYQSTMKCTTNCYGECEMGARLCVECSGMSRRTNVAVSFIPSDDRMRYKQGWFFFFFLSTGVVHAAVQFTALCKTF